MRKITFRIPYQFIISCGHRAFHPIHRYSVKLRDYCPGKGFFSYLCSSASAFNTAQTYRGELCRVSALKSEYLSYWTVWALQTIMHMNVGKSSSRSLAGFFSPKFGFVPAVHRFPDDSIIQSSCGITVRVKVSAFIREHRQVSLALYRVAW